MPVYQGQLADLREYSDNPWVRDLNSKAIRDKNRERKKHLSLTSIKWPIGLTVVAYVQWQEHEPGAGKGRGWRAKQGRILAIHRWHATVDM